MMSPFLLVSVIIIVSLIGSIGGLFWFRQRNSFLAMTHYDNGVSYLQTGEYSKAADEFKIALKRQGSLVDAQYGLGLTYIQQNRYQEGIEVLESVVREIPDNAIAYYNLGRAYINLGNLDKARRALEAALTINPEVKEIHFNLARLFQEKGNIEQARIYCRNALKLDSNYIKAKDYLNLLTGLRHVKSVNLEAIYKALKDFDQTDTEFMINL
jgi:tetratricopeptide (TPR) repeat protein